MSTNNNQTPPLSILLWNANGLTHNKNELQHLLYDKKINIALITETHLTPTKHFNIPGYTTHRTDHPDGTAHAGTAILISTTLLHYALPTYQKAYIQATNIQIILNHIPITISSVYCPPNQKITPPRLQTFLRTLKNSFIIGGDFNAKHTAFGCRSTNPRGQTFYNTILNNHLSFISPSAPTYWPSHTNRHPDILDFFITSLPNHLNNNIKNLEELSSDHSPVLLHLGGKPENVNNTPHSRQINFNLFQNKLDEYISLNIRLKTRDDIDSASQFLITTIQKAITDSTSSPSNTNTPIKPHQYTYLPQNLKELIKKKRQARKIWHQTRYPEHKHELNKLTNKLKKDLQTFKTNQFHSFLSSLTPVNGSLWKSIKNKTKRKDVVPPLTNPNNTLAITDSEKANLFGNHLSEIFQPHSDTNYNITTHIENVQTFLNSPLPMSLPAKPITPQEIKYYITKLHNNKSPGYDLINNKILKKLTNKTILLLTHIYNAMLRLSYIPPIWKFSTIILIAKPEKPKHLVTSYRPISLLPTLGKLFEKLLLKRITPIIKEKNIIPNSQFGFRSYHSTIHQIHRITDKISSSFEKKEHCPGVFLDIAQAFDRVWHDGLLFKLKSFLPAPYFLILKSFLEDRFFTVKHNNSYSPYYKLNAGVPQGSDLSPILYNIYTYDLPRTNHTTLATYADDTAILASNKDPNIASHNIQYHLNLISNWANKWKIKINENKSVQVNFTLKKNDCPQLSLNNIPIPIKNETKYLGVHLDKRLTWAQHTKNKRKQSNTRLHLLRPLLSPSTNLKNKILIYKTIITPLWSYGIQIWGQAKPSNIRPIQAFQSICLRKITGAPWYMTNNALHNDLQIPTITELATRQYKKFHSKLNLHPNPLISRMSSITIPNNPPRRLKRKWPRDALI